jgi:hypothetical protein
MGRSGPLAYLATVADKNGTPVSRRFFPTTVAGDGIYALAIDRTRSVILGLSYPTGHFFTYEIAEKRFADHGPVAAAFIPGEKFEREKAMGRAIAIAEDGAAFTSGQDGRMYRFQPATGKLERLEVTVPSVPGRAAYNRVDAWAAGQCGDVLYVGTSDGSLCSDSIQKP